MAVDTKAIKQKIVAVGNVGKVTKTMEMVSISKMKRTVENRKKTAIYAKYALSILEKVSALHDIQHPLFKERKNGKSLLVIIASDKGLCGPYNTRIERATLEFVKNNTSNDSESEIDVIAIGKKSQNIAKKYKLSVKEAMSAFTEKTKGDEIRDLVDILKKLYIQDSTYKSVSVIFTEFISSLEFQVVENTILPIRSSLLPDVLDIDKDINKNINTDINKNKEGVNKSANLYTLEPDEDVILEELLPVLLQVGIYQFMLESLASEHSSRMLAMRNASDNASRLKERLTGEYNRARQAGVTKEIIEIVNAASAV